MLSIPLLSSRTRPKLTCATKDVCARLHVNVALETSASPNNKEPGLTPGTGVPLSSPTRSDSAHTPRLQTSFGEASWDQKLAQSSSWQSAGSPTIPSPLSLDLVYGLWNTCVSDGEEAQIVLPLESGLDGDIFGVGKRPIQREIEKDGCIRLVFVE